MTHLPGLSYKLACFLSEQGLVFVNTGIRLYYEGFFIMPKRTYQPKVRRRLRVHGFRRRMSSSKGRQVIKSRRLKGRAQLAVKRNHVKKVNWKS